MRQVGRWTWALAGCALSIAPGCGDDTASTTGGAGGAGGEGSTSTVTTTTTGSGATTSTTTTTTSTTTTVTTGGEGAGGAGGAGPGGGGSGGEGGGDITCRSTETECGGACVDTGSDPDHCGACDAPCDVGEVCNGGLCALSCSPGLAACDGACVNPATDEDHCGADVADCAADPGAVCDAGSSCQDGTCRLSCQAGLVDCNGTCIDPLTNDAFCGADLTDCAADPGVACGAGFTCDGSGTCALSCQQGLVECDGTCVDPLTDNTFCGADPTDCAADPGETCAAGTTCNGAGSCELSCQQGLVACDGVCTDPLTSNTHCGADPTDCAADPGVTCAAGTTCNGAGSCELSCQQGLVACNGVCVDPLTDNTYCGAGADCDVDPGVACAPGTTCNGAGECELTCQAGFAECDGACVDPTTDEAHCGADPDDCGADPGVVCPAGFSCEDGACELACQAGLIACDGSCIDPGSDRDFCGAGADCALDPGEACADDEACFLGECRELGLADLTVGVMGGSFYTDNLRAFLDAEPNLTAVTINDCSAQTLAAYDVVWLYGNMSCFDPVAFDAYVQAGGGIVATPWIHNNYNGFSSLPVVYGGGSNAIYNTPLAVTVTDPTNVLLTGVTFTQGDPVGYERSGFTLAPGAENGVVWTSGADHMAVAHREVGLGRSVYLNFHYITSDCELAIDHAWGQRLARNAVHWAGGNPVF